MRPVLPQCLGPAVLEEVVVAVQRVSCVADDQNAMIKVLLLAPARWRVLQPEGF